MSNHTVVLEHLLTCTRRYTSMIVMLFSNFGFFYHHFSPETCARYCYVAPVFKGTGPVLCRVRAPKAE